MVLEILSKPKLNQNLSQNKFLFHVYDESNVNKIFIVETVSPISQEPFIAQTSAYMQNEQEDITFLHILSTSP